MYANLSKYNYETFICGCHFFVYINIHFGKKTKNKKQMAGMSPSIWKKNLPKSELKDNSA